MSEKQIAGQEQAKQIPHSAEFITCDISEAESQRRKEAREKAIRLERRLKSEPEKQAQWSEALGSCNSVEELEQLNTYRLAPAVVNALKPYAEKIRSLLNKSVENIVQVGEQLIEAKKIAGHGHWCQWIQDNCGISQDSVTRYMKLAEFNASNPESLKNVTGLKEAYIVSGIIALKPKASPKSAAGQAGSSDDTTPTTPAIAPEPIEPAKPPVVAASIEVDMTAEAQRHSSSGDEQQEMSYLEKAFGHGRLTLAVAVEFLVSHREEIEDIELLKPLADFYAMKTQGFRLNPVEDAIAA